MNEYLELDQITLAQISKDAGRPIESDTYLASLQEAKESGCLFEVRRKGNLLSYATLNALGDDKWFVLMFVTHPDHRGRKSFLELMSKIIQHLKAAGALSLISNVYRVNKQSVAFHKKLGFNITREAEAGFEFTLPLNSPAAQKWHNWVEQTKG